MVHRRYRLSLVAVFASFSMTRAAVGQEPSPPADPAPSKPADGAPKPEQPAAPEAAEAASAEGAEEDPARPPPRGKGVVWGVVTDTKLNEPIIEGPVAVVGTNLRVFTDIDGRYRIELPPGTYSLRLSYELHQSARIGNVRVVEGEVLQIDAKLTPDESAVETIVVEAEADRTSLEGQTLTRKRAATVSDGVGRAEIARTPDRNAAEAAKRVVGATVVGDRFVYVRGLGERYTNATLNGSPLPSPEPDRNTVPLDLFPALIIDSITISKSFTPDMPADFAGGSVAVFTRRFPRETLLQASVNAGFNTVTTFAEAPGYQGSGTDWLGFDGGTRALPSQVPDEKVTPQEAAEVGKAVNSRMSTSPVTLLPNFGGSIVAGDSFKLGEHQKLGFVAALSYGRSSEFRKGEIGRLYRSDDLSPDDLTTIEEVTGDSAFERVRWGALGTVTYEISPEHRVSLTGFRSQLADDLARELESVDDEGTFHQTRLQYISRSLNVGQVSGEHEFVELLGGKLDWSGSVALAARDEPDTRSNEYLFNGSQTPPNWTWQTNAESGAHFFAEHTETSLAGALDWTQPLGKGDESPKVKVGGRISARSRDFSARRFEFGRRSGQQGDLRRCEGVEYPVSCPDKLFLQNNVGTILSFTEKTRENDAYDASLNVYAAYLMVDAEVLDGLRAVAGARIEATEQSIDSFDPYARDRPIKGEIAETDILPAVSAIYAVTPNSNTRFSVSRTLARPQLREFAPFTSTSEGVDGRSVRGNPELALTHVTNVDLRFEHFPTLREVLAFSVFYKHFKDAIEETQLPTTGEPIITYENVSGRLIGLEIELRKSLNFVAPVLEDVGVGANVALVRSQIELAKQGVDTNATRPLANQSPYVINASIDYSRAASRTLARVTYNVSGPRLVTVGRAPFPDTYEQPRHGLDLTVVQGVGEHLEIKGTVQNLLDSPVRRTQAASDPDGDGPREGEELLVSRYLAGASVTLSATYTY